VLRLRDQLNRRAVELLSIVADTAESDGRIDDAIRALDRMSDLDPYDETVLERARDLLLDAGRREQAQRWDERLRRLQEE
jgi:DNA-binding SARP family transcriptional activator